MKSKKCPKCGEIKLAEKFTKNKNPNSKTGLYSWCKKCSNAYTKSRLASKTKQAKEILAEREDRLNRYLKSIEMTYDEYLGQPIYKQIEIEEIAYAMDHRVITTTLTDGRVITYEVNKKLAR